MASNQASKFDKFIKVTIYLGIFSVWGALIFYRINFKGDLSSESQEWSNFGSFYGGLLGPLLSFITIIVLLRTLKNQELDLKLKQEEATFFKMVDFLIRTVDNMEIRWRGLGQPAEQRNGNAAFNFIVRELSSELNILFKLNKLTDEELKRIFHSYYKNYRTSLGSFFRLIENILIFIDRSSLDDEAKLQYISILKSILTPRQPPYFGQNPSKGSGRDLVFIV